MKKKCYVLIISEYFPKTHLKSGKKTHFKQQIESGLKIHTVRGNYDLWEKRINEINEGLAYLSVRKWTGKPYNSKQEELFIFKKLGIEGINIDYGEGYVTSQINERNYNSSLQFIAMNDGLWYKDFIDWFFKKEGEYFEGCIIHFTDFRYNTL